MYNSLRNRVSQEREESSLPRLQTLEPRTEPAIFGEERASAAPHALVGQHFAIRVVLRTTTRAKVRKGRACRKPAGISTVAIADAVVQYSTKQRQKLMWSSAFVSL